MSDSRIGEPCAAICEMCMLRNRLSLHDDGRPFYARPYRKCDMCGHEQLLHPKENINYFTMFSRMNIHDHTMEIRSSD